MFFSDSVRGARRTVAAGTIFAAILLAACSSSASKPIPGGNAIAVGSPAASSATATPDSRPRPKGVPADAQQLLADAQFGDAANAGRNGQKLVSLSCKDSVITIALTTNVFFAELPCDRTLPEKNVKMFLGKPLLVRVVVAAPSKLHMQSNAAGTVEFTVGRVWVQTPR